MSSNNAAETVTAKDLAEADLPAQMVTAEAGPRGLTETGGTTRLDKTAIGAAVLLDRVTEGASKSHPGIFLRQSASRHPMKNPPKKAFTMKAPCALYSLRQKMPIGRRKWRLSIVQMSPCRQT